MTDDVLAIELLVVANRSPWHQTGTWLTGPDQEHPPQPVHCPAHGIDAALGVKTIPCAKDVLSERPERLPGAVALIDLAPDFAVRMLLREDEVESGARILVEPEPIEGNDQEGASQMCLSSTHFPG